MAGENDDHICRQNWVKKDLAELGGKRREDRGGRGEVGR